MEKAATFGFLAFAVFLAVHWTLFCLRPVSNRSRFLIRLTFACILLMVVRFTKFHVSGHSFGMDLQTPRFIVALVSFACLWVLYMPFYYSIQTSLSLGMLIRLTAAGSEGIPLPELRPDAHAKRIVEQRLAAMEGAGYLWREDGRYVLTSKGRFIARTFGKIKRFWNLGAGG